MHINGMAFERVSSFKFLETHISEDLSWITNTVLVKKAHQHLFYLNTLKKNHLSSAILVNFYRCAIESILTNCITVWEWEWYGNCSVADCKALQREVKTAQRVIGTPLPAIEDIQKKRYLRRAHSILKDSSHPAHSLFKLLPSRRLQKEPPDQNQQTKEQLFSYSCELCPPLNPFVFSHHNTLLIPPSD
ncbi:hypothetical protein QTP70_001990 [Hemibagrus guttatus]|uniref:Alkylated DNA repair protein AlkB homologue 8 N-terminal domain-containing protein n=1 Tax=Hemibagrus guttatus TaxID=175788 RepID=A0AAE0QW62_9TELE|nr:hypothetical protein QTP70_001990 [Hemibagrus guttatus]